MLARFTLRFSGPKSSKETNLNIIIINNIAVVFDITTVAVQHVNCVSALRRFLNG